MNFEEIDRLVRGANPVPDPIQLGSASPTTGTSHERWSTTMQIQDLSDTTAIRRRAGDGWRMPKLVGAAAALLVVVALVASSAISGDDDGTAPPAATAASPVDLADSFLTAFAAGDARQAASHLGPDALAESGGVDGLRQELRWREASGWQWLFDPCEPVGDGAARTILRCPFSYHGVRSNERGLPPFEGSSYRIVVGAEGQITSFTETIEYQDNDFNDLVWEPFYEWLTANHPDDVDVMYTDTGSGYSVTDESIALWERRSREYVSAVADG